MQTPLKPLFEETNKATINPRDKENPGIIFFIIPLPLSNRTRQHYYNLSKFRLSIRPDSAKSFTFVISNSQLPFKLRSRQIEREILCFFLHFCTKPACQFPSHFNVRLQSIYIAPLFSSAFFWGPLFVMEDKPSLEAMSRTVPFTGDQLTTQSDVEIKDNDGIIPQLFERASCLSNRFQEFIEDLVVKDARTNIVESPISFSEGHPGHASNSGNCSCLSVDNDGASAISASESSNSVSASEGRIAVTSAVASPMNFSNSALVEATQSFWNAPNFFKGLVARVQTTLRGSANDIGWLLRTPGMPSVEDGTSRFMELLERIRIGEHMLPDTLVYLLVPGLFSNHGPLYFVDTKKVFSKLGLACHIAKIHSEASVETNAWELKQYIEELYWGSGKRVMLLGHSKGGVDAAAALAMYWPDLKDKVAGLALVQSPYGGSPIASDILREGQIADIETRRIMELLICKVIKGDMRALEDLTYDKRREFISKHMLPTDVPLVSFHTEVSIAPGVMATMSHIAHAELPWFSLPSTNTNSEEAASQRTKVPVAVPVAAAMAMCAMHLQLRYGEKSDGLVTRKDAEVPGSVVVRPDRKLDHAWMVYSSITKDTTESNASQMCEALLALLVEIGQRKSGSVADKFVK